MMSMLAMTAMCANANAAESSAARTAASIASALTPRLQPMPIARRRWLAQECIMERMGGKLGAAHASLADGGVRRRHRYVIAMRFVSCAGRYPGLRPSSRSLPTVNGQWPCAPCAAS
ncbi:exported hypothetical protein [Burkholderia sp. 8Y]|nr:exported hypothetical protein [Burkholderia sp. 8Y]